MSKWFSTPVTTLTFSALILFISFLISIESQAAQATLTWDPNDPSPDGYCIYRRVEGQTYDYNQPCWIGIGTTGTVDGLEENTTHYFVVRAYVQVEESLDSNEVSLNAVAPTIEVINFDQFISESGTAAIELDVFDPNGGNLTYTWELPDGGSISGSDNLVWFVPESSGPHPCPYRANVVVSSDASPLSSAYLFYIYVKLAGDINGDGYVNFADLAQLRADFGITGDPGWVPADVNSDGYVNFADLAILRSQFGLTGCAYP